MAPDHRVDEETTHVVILARKLSQTQWVAWVPGLDVTPVGLAGTQLEAVKIVQGKLEEAFGLQGELVSIHG
jgi:hypothetical protein